MSYILYINGALIDMGVEKPIAQTKQVNDLAKFENRQANFTPTFKVPMTANNIRNLGKLALTGSNSPVPYQKNEANLFDADNGVCMIYKGWAKIMQSSAGVYEINVFDGNIDFYKKVENKTLTQVGISDLNHLKNLSTVIASFDNSQPYKYIVADYNGKTLSDDLQINIDYLVPSAKTKYIWDRIFDFAGHTYSGSIFNTEAFTNHWMTFPKPVPTTTPVVTPVTEQDSTITISPVSYPNGGGMGGVFLGSSYIAKILPVAFDTAEANNTNGYVTIEQTGSYRLNCNGTLQTPATTNSIILYKLTDASGLIRVEGQIDAANNETVILQATATDKLYLQAQLFGYSAPEAFMPLTGTIHTKFDLIIGYGANFEEALVDFQAKDFVNEIMTRLGLTMFKDKYSNNVEFLTLTEILQNADVIDWSDKFSLKNGEKYTIGGYAQKNLLKYRYNEENQSHNDGAIMVDNKNLDDETTIVNSKIYSPEKEPNKISNLVLLFNNVPINIYRMWNKQVKDDGTVEYRELDGRYYFMRSEDYVFPGPPQTLVSEVLNTSEPVTMVPRESFHRMSFQEIVYDYYAPIESILNGAKVLDALFNLNTLDVATFTFKQLIYVKQLSSYYLVNKIQNFVKNVPTKCELIEVDFMREIDLPEITDGTFITLDDPVIDGCDVTLTFTTDQPLPAFFTISATRDTFGGIPNPATDTFVQTLQLTTNTVTFSLPAGGSWSIVLQLGSGSIVSNIAFVNNFFTCAPEPPPSTLTFLTITSIETLSVVGNQRNIKINYITDWNFLGTLTMSKVATTFGGFGSQDYLFTGPPPEMAVYHTVTDNAFGNNMTWQIKLIVGSIFSNTVNSI